MARMNWDKTNKNKLTLTRGHESAYEMLEVPKKGKRHKKKNKVIPKNNKPSKKERVRGIIYSEQDVLESRARNLQNHIRERTEKREKLIKLISTHKKILNESTSKLTAIDNDLARSIEKLRNLMEEKKLNSTATGKI